MKIKTITGAVALILAGMGTLPSYLYAQTDSTGAPIPNKARGGAEKLLLAGEVSTLWQSSKVNAFNGAPTTTANTFAANPLGLMLMPLVKINDRLFLDVQVAITANPSAGGGAAATLNEAIIGYHLAPGVNIFAGNFQPRSGLYEGILDDFTNRYCTSPVGMGLGPQTESGIGIQGGLQTGCSKVLYQVYVANGPQLVVDSTGATNGQLTYANYIDNNLNKVIGGEIGFLPFSNSCLEVGVSGQYSPKTGNTGSPLENINSTSMAAYLNYYHIFNPLMIRLQGQYEMTQVQSFSLFKNSSDTSVMVPSFKDQVTGWYAGITLRLSGSRKTFLSNLELGLRVGQLTLPQDTLCPWHAKPLNQTTICLTYWFTWKTPLNIAYDIYTQAGSPTQTAITIRGMWFF
jgi:hypothetical protein